MKLIRCLALVLTACGTGAEGPLSVTQLSPSRGSARGGQVVTLEGTGFGPAATVRVGGTAARVKEVTDTKLTLVMPTGIAGPASVEVAVGDRRAVLDGGFSYERLTFSLVDAADQRLAAWPLEGAGLATADYQADGDLDVFQAARGEGVELMINDGLGGFQTHLTIGAPTPDAGPVDVWSVTAADFNGDGQLDLFLGATGAKRTRLLLGTSAGQFSPAPDALPPLFGTAQVATPIDLEPDGDLDLLVTGSASVESGAPVVMVLVNDGHGSFRDASERLAGGALAATGITVGDFDHDGDADLFFSMDAESCRLFLSDGHGAFQRAAGDALPHDLAPHAGQAAVGDLNDDGFLDLFVPTSTQDKVFINDGTAHFADLTEAFLGPESSVGVAARLVDLDLDGHLDVVVVERPGRVRLLRNDGEGRLFDYSAEAVGNDAQLRVADVAIADFDLDGVPEVFVSHAGQSRAALFVLTLDAPDSDGDRWPDRYDACPSRPTPSRPRLPFGCASGSCAAQSGCELKTFGSSAYLVCMGPSTWEQAKTRCAASGGQLLQIAGPAENDFVHGTLSAAAWLGATDRAVEGTWEGATWFNWGPGQPDNSNDEDCASVQASGAWNDLPCGGQALTVCETARETPVDPGACLIADGGT